MSSDDILLSLLLKTTVNSFNASIKYLVTNTYFLSIVVKKSFSFSKYVKVHPLVEVLTIRTRPPCKREVINCYVTSDTASYYAFKCYLSKTWYYSVISLEGSL